MNTKEKFIKDMLSIKNSLDCDEINGLISQGSWWILDTIIDELIDDADKHAEGIELHFEILRRE
jgi:hypothetical protein